MAITKTHPIKSTLKAAIDYILNPEKTDGTLLASSFGCGMETAEQKEVDTYEQNKSDFDSFAVIIRKYVGIMELMPAIVNEFIKKIVVHAPEKVNGKRYQKVDIVFNFVGEIHFPTDSQPERNETEEQEKTA